MGKVSTTTVLSFTTKRSRGGKGLQTIQEYCSDYFVGRVWFKRKEKKKNADNVHCRHGSGKDVVLCSAPPNGCRDTQHFTWRIKTRGAFQWESGDCLVYRLVWITKASSLAWLLINL